MLDRTGCTSMIARYHTKKMAWDRLRRCRRQFCAGDQVWSKEIPRVMDLWYRVSCHLKPKKCIYRAAATSGKQDDQFLLCGTCRYCYGLQWSVDPEWRIIVIMKWHLHYFHCSASVISNIELLDAWKNRLPPWPLKIKGIVHNYCFVREHDAARWTWKRVYLFLVDWEGD